jgi:hypothetical protein
MSAFGSKELYENPPAIEQWRSTLSEKQRRLVHPISNVRRWRIATNGYGRGPADFRRDGEAARQRVVCCLRAMSADDAAKLRSKIRDEIIPTCETSPVAA